MNECSNKNTFGQDCGKCKHCLELMRQTINEEFDKEISRVDNQAALDKIIATAIKKAFNIKHFGAEVTLDSVQPDRMNHVVYALAREVHRLQLMVAKRISVIQSLDHALANTRDIICKHWQTPESLQG